MGENITDTFGTMAAASRVAGGRRQFRRYILSGQRRPDEDMLREELSSWCCMQIIVITLWYCIRCIVQSQLSCCLTVLLSPLRKHTCFEFQRAQYFTCINCINISMFLPTTSTPFIGSIENIFNDESFSRDTLTLGITVKWTFQVNKLFLMGFSKVSKNRLKMNRVNGKQAMCDYSNGVYNYMYMDISSQYIII